MILLLILGLLSLISFLWVYLLDMSISNLTLYQTQLISSQIQNRFTTKENQKIAKLALDFYNQNWSWLNNISSNFIDSNQNDDNYKCYKNFWTFVDDDCYFGNIIWIILPNQKLNLWYFENIVWSWFSWFVSWNNLNLNLLLFNQNFKKLLEKKIETKTWKITFNLNWNYYLFIENQSSWEVFFRLNILSWEYLNKVEIHSWNIIITYKWLPFTKNWFFLNKKKVNFTFTGIIRPTNPIWLSIISWDFNDWWSDSCQWTWNNDIVISWLFTWDISLSGQYYFEILTWTTPNLWNILSGLKLNDYCSFDKNKNWKCSWTWYDRITGDYYFKINSWRCLTGDCSKFVKNVWWSNIKKIHIDYCK